MRLPPCTTFQMRTESGLEGHRVESLKFFGMMVARDGVEPPPPAFSELGFPVFPTTSRVAVGLPNTGKYDKNDGTVGDRHG